MEKHKKREITVEKAAEMLSVTPRSVINYIKSKDIEAVKVGKNWFIAKASIDAFSRKHGFNKNTQTEISANFPEKIPETHIIESPNPKSGRDTQILASLRIFQKMKLVLGDDQSRLDEMSLNQDVKRRIEMLKNDAIELLGAGFYTYGTKNKVFYYNRSREKISSILALIYFSDQDKTANSLAQKIESELMPMYSSLIKKIEQKLDKK